MIRFGKDSLQMVLPPGGTSAFLITSNIHFSSWLLHMHITGVCEAKWGSMTVMYYYHFAWWWGPFAQITLCKKGSLTWPFMLHYTKLREIAGKFKASWVFPHGNNGVRNKGPVMGCRCYASSAYWLSSCIIAGHDDNFAQWGRFLSVHCLCGKSFMLIGKRVCVCVQGSLRSMHCNFCEKWIRITHLRGSFPDNSWLDEHFWSSRSNCSIILYCFSAQHSFHLQRNKAINCREIYLFGFGVHLNAVNRCVFLISVLVSQGPVSWWRAGTLRGPRRHGQTFWKTQEMKTWSSGNWICPTPSPLKPLLSSSLKVCWSGFCWCCLWKCE